jgi:hypothetical protein
MPRTDQSNYVCDRCGIETGWVYKMPPGWSWWERLSSRVSSDPSVMYLCPACTPQPQP